MGDRYDISVDIGEGKDWWYVHGLATHDMVYELNRQMCDIDKHLSEAGYFGMICEGQVEARKKLKDMEEKKTKKMTKAEAFEYLKGKRVACDSNNEELVQRKLFEVGIRWRGGKADVTSVAPFLFINPNGITHCGSREWFDLHEYEEISADDILSIEIVEKEETENINIELEKWIGVVRNKFCCNGWSFVISASNFALIKGDLIEERTPNK